MGLLLIVIFFGVALVLISLTPFNETKKSSSPLTFLSVVVCFRDEEQALPSLLESIQNAIPKTNLILEFIFVDDHSSDASQTTIAKANIEHSKCFLSNGKGKKAALRTGVGLANYDHILFLDADVTFSEFYFNEIHNTVNASAELTVLPAIPVANQSLLQQFQALEFLCMSLVSKSVERFRPPLLCNGANLLVQKHAWKEVVKDLHFGLASGDDMFLLQALKKRERKIDSLHAENLRVYFEVEKSVTSFLAQRTRWGSKAKRYSDCTLLGIAYFMVLSQLALVTLLFGGLFQKISLTYFLWSIIALQLILLTLIRPALQKHYSLPNYLFSYVIFPLIYPVYLLVSSSMSVIKKSTWKGRRV